MCYHDHAYFVNQHLWSNVHYSDAHVLLGHPNEVVSCLTGGTHGCDIYNIVLWYFHKSFIISLLLLPFWVLITFKNAHDPSRPYSPMHASTYLYDSTICTFTSFYSYFIDKHNLLVHACFSAGLVQALQLPHLSDLQPTQVPQWRFLLFLAIDRHSIDMIHTFTTVHTAMKHFEIT